MLLEATAACRVLLPLPLFLSFFLKDEVDDFEEETDSGGNWVYHATSTSISLAVDAAGGQVLADALQEAVAVMDSVARHQDVRATKDLQTLDVVKALFSGGWVEVLMEHINKNLTDAHQPPTDRVEFADVSLTHHRTQSRSPVPGLTLPSSHLPD